MRFFFHCDNVDLERTQKHVFFFFDISVIVSGAYRNFPKYSDTQKICCNHSKILTMRAHRVMSPNHADGMANSVDPDRPAPLGGI